jgi:hypothetical protein
MKVQLFSTIYFYSEDNGSQYIPVGPPIRELEIDARALWPMNAKLNLQHLTLVPVAGPENVEACLASAEEHASQIIKNMERQDTERKAKEAKARKAEVVLKEKLKKLQDKANELKIPKKVWEDLSYSKLKTLVDAYNEK